MGRDERLATEGRPSSLDEDDCPMCDGDGEFHGRTLSGILTVRVCKLCHGRGQTTNQDMGHA